MSLMRINRNPTGRQLAVFALAWLGLGGILGFRLWLRGHGPAAEVVWSVAAGVPLAGAVSRRLLRWIYLGLSYATYPIGLAVSCAFLAVVFYLVLTPVGLVARLFRHDPLSCRFDAKARSYWSSRSPTNSVKDYFRQS